MSSLSVHNLQGISQYQNEIEIPNGHSLNISSDMTLPRWSTPNRPSGVLGKFGWNTTLEQLEIYDGIEWVKIVSSAIGTATKPATSALELVQNGQTTNGVYYIKATEDSPTQQIYCILDPAYDGGGWMVLANNAAIGIIRNTAHIPRLTAYTNHVGSSGANSYTSNYNFSVNGKNLAFNKMVWVITQSNTSFLGSNGGNVNGYIYYQWSNKLAIPDEQQYWAFDNGLQGFSMGNQVTWPGFGAKRMNSSYGGYGQYQSQNYGFGTYDDNSFGPINAYPGKGTRYRVNGSNGQYYPVTCTMQGCSGNSGDVRAYYCWSWSDYQATSSGAYQGIGFDDWQDGSGLGDQWRCESTNDKTTTRGKPSFIMVK